MAIDLRAKDVKYLSVPFSYVALNYNDLVANVPSAENGALAYVYNSQGTAWLPFTLGGTYYPNGTYVFSGSTWVSDRNAIANEFSNVINDIDNIEIVLDAHTTQLTDLQNDLTDKLDKSTYIGTAQDLKNDIDTKANISHTHIISDITGLQTDLDSKASITYVDNKDESFFYFNNDSIIILDDSTILTNNKIQNFVYENCKITINTNGIDLLNGQTSVSFKKGYGNIQIVKKSNGNYLII